MRAIGSAVAGSAIDRTGPLPPTDRAIAMIRKTPGRLDTGNVIPLWCHKIFEPSGYTI
jgi:hypothetical protein